MHMFHGLSIRHPSSSWSVKAFSSFCFVSLIYFFDLIVNLALMLTLYQFQVLTVNTSSVPDAFQGISLLVSVRLTSILAHVPFLIFFLCIIYSPRGLCPIIDFTTLYASTRPWAFFTLVDCLVHLEGRTPSARSLQDPT